MNTTQSHPSQGLRRLPIGRYTTMQGQALSYIYGGTDSLGFNTGEVQYQLSADTDVVITPNAPLFALQLNDEPAWVELPEQLLANFVGPSFPELNLRSVPAHYLGFVVESGTSWLLDWLESITGWKIQILRAEFGQAASELRQLIYHKTNRQITPVCFRMQDSQGLNCALHLYLGDKNLETLARRLPRISTPRQSAPTDLPIPYHVNLGSTELELEELKTVQAGDVLVVEKTLLHRQRVGVIISDELNYTAVLDGDSIQIESIGYDLMSNTPSNLDNLAVNVSFELSRTRMPLDQLNRLAPGAVLKVGKDLNAPIDIVANGKRIAVGDLVDMDGTVAVRISKIL